jgi:hypothetical protein
MVFTVGSSSYVSGRLPTLVVGLAGVAQPVLSAPIPTKAMIVGLSMPCISDLREGHKETAESSLSVCAVWSSFWR